MGMRKKIKIYQFVPEFRSNQAEVDKTESIQYCNLYLT